MQIPGSSKSLSDWSFLQCSHVKNFPNFSPSFFSEKLHFSHLNKKTSRSKIQENFKFPMTATKLWGLKNIHGAFLVGPDLQRKKKHKTPRRCCFDPAWGFSVFLLAALVGEKEFTMERKKEVHEKITSTALGYKKRLLVKSNMNMTFWIEMIFKNHGILRIG